MKITLRVPEGEPARRADKALARLLPEASPARLRGLFREREVRRKGKRVAAEEMVSPGDVLEVFVKAEAPWRPPPDIVFEDGEYVIVSKPQGIPTQGPASAEETAARLLGAPMHACHRLDVQTGGLLLLAKTNEALARAEEAFRAHLLKKTYRALVCGIPGEREAVLRHYLRKRAKEARVDILPGPAPGALPIETGYRVVAEEQGLARLEIDLVTGRTHQIRAHLAFIGHPVLGDDKYGNRRENHARHARRQKLWATGLTLWDGRHFQVEEPF